MFGNINARLAQRKTHCKQINFEHFASHLISPFELLSVSLWGGPQAKKKNKSPQFREDQSRSHFGGSPHSDTNHQGGLEFGLLPCRNVLPTDPHALRQDVLDPHLEASSRLVHACVCLRVCPYICLSVCLSVCPSVCLSVCLYADTCIHVSVPASVRYERTNVCMHTYVPVHVSVCLSSVCMYVCTYVCTHACHCVCLRVSVCLPICLSVHLCVPAAVCYDVRTYACMHVCVCARVGLPAFLPACLLVCLLVCLPACLPGCLSVGRPVCLYVPAHACM